MPYMEHYIKHTRDAKNKSMSLLLYKHQSYLDKIFDLAKRRSDNIISKSYLFQCATIRQVSP